jgi:D-lactate dehydrogenase
MRVAVFSSRNYDKVFLTQANETGQHGFDFSFFEAHLQENTTILAQGHDAICIFVNDRLDANILSKLKENGVRFVVLRCAGFNNVDLDAATKLGIRVLRVPAYSPYAVAEHAIGLIMALNRKYHRAYNRVREGNFALDGLLGFNIRGKTIGVVGTGKIGEAFIETISGFGCQILAYDVQQNPAIEKFKAQYVSMDVLFAQSDMISLHCPLIPQTHHMINEETIQTMKTGVMLINTSRGGIIDTKSVIEGLKTGKIGALGLDVYEEEEHLFFEDLSNHIIQDDVFSRLLTFPNVLITGHQAFLTDTALGNIAQTTLDNLKSCAENTESFNQVNK